MKVIVLFYNSDFKSVASGECCGVRHDLHSVVNHDLKLMEGLSGLKGVTFLADEHAPELEKLVSGREVPFPIQVIRAHLDQINPFEKEFLSKVYDGSQERLCSTDSAEAQEKLLSTGGDERWTGESSMDGDGNQKKAGPSSLLVIHSHLYMSRSCLMVLAGRSKTSILSVLPPNGQTVVADVSTEGITNPCFGCFTSAEGVKCYPALKIVGEDIVRILEKGEAEEQKISSASFEEEKEQPVERLSLCNVPSGCVFDLGDEVQRSYAEKAGWIFFQERDIVTISYAELLMKSLDEFIAWNGASRAVVVVDPYEEEETPAMR